MPVVAALPDLALALAGVFLLILGLALFALRRLLVSAFSHVPLIGGWIGGTLGGWIESAASEITSFADASFHGAERLFETVSQWTTRMMNAVGAAVYEIGGTIEHVITQVIPREAAIAWRYSNALYWRLYHNANNWVHDAIRYSETLYWRLYHTAVTWYHDAISYATVTGIRAERYALDLFRTAELDMRRAVDTAEAIALRDLRTAERVLSADISDAIARADDLFHTAETDALREVNRAEVIASAQIAAATAGIITDLETWGNQAVDVVWRDAAGDIDALRQVLGDAFPDIQSLLKFLEGAGAAGLIGALIRALAGSAVATRALKDCVIPNCKNLSQLGKDLSELSSVASAAALLGFLGFIAVDPVTAADDTVRVIDPFVNALFGPLASLISAGAEHI